MDERQEQSEFKTDQAPEPRQNNWAPASPRIKVSAVPAGATNMNLDGRRTAGALQGFGQLWQKTYQVRLNGLQMSPVEVMRIWKENFPRFQPPENRFYPTMSGIRPGEVLFIDAKVPAFPGSPKIMPMLSGVMVLYVDDESFTVMTPEGFPESGWNTFSVFEDQDSIVAQIQSMCRASDPLYEFFFRFLGSSAQQEKIWVHVLSSLANYLGMNGAVTVRQSCIDSRVQWIYARNVWHSAAIRSVFYKLSTPMRWLRQKRF